MYDKSPRCKICKSEICDKIDNFLVQGKSYEVVAEWANKIEPELKLSKKNLWNHNIKHRLQNTDIKKLKRGRKTKKERETTEKAIKTKKVVKKVVKKKIKEELEKENPQLDLDNTTIYLNKLIQKAYEKLENGKSSPTITEAIKAIELKHKMEKNSPFEDVLLNFVEKVVDDGLRS